MQDADGRTFWRPRAWNTPAFIQPRSVRRRGRRADGPQPSYGRHGRNHGNGDLGAGLQLHLAEHLLALARTLKLNGYSTAQFGKCHEVPVWETSPVGPFDAWPTGGGGFEYFYGFIGGEANQWYPSLYEGTTPIEVKKTPEEGYHFMEDMTDKAIDWIGQQKALTAGQAFLRLLRAGSDACAAPRSEGMGGQVQGQIRSGLGQAARGDLRPAEKIRRDSAGLQTHAAATKKFPHGTKCLPR